jgi:serine/threonine-protein kinase SRPK3
METTRGSQQKKKFILIHVTAVPTIPGNLAAAIDVWAFACTLASILGDGELFSSEFMADRDGLFFTWVRSLGKLPDKWWDRWEGRSKEFEKNVSFKPDDPHETSENSLRQSLVGMRIGGGWEVGEGLKSAFGSRELDALEMLFGSMLKYHVGERIGAEEIVGLMPVAWNKGMFV